MARRSDERDAARAEYIARMEKDGEVNLRQLADDLHLKYDTVRRWKAKDGWGPPAPRKPGGQPGNKNAVGNPGGGAPVGNENAMKDAHAANNVNFQTDYDKRVEKIGAVVDGCSLLLEYLTICTEEGIISAKKAGIWTKKVTDVKYPAMKWLTSERGRAEKLRAEAERKRLTEQAAALKAVLYPEP